MDEKNANLEQLRIHELRDLARKMGVNAPTSKKKEQLIDEIMKIMNGESLPYTEPTKKGRPVRVNSDNFDVVDLILPNQNELSTLYEYSEYDTEQDKMHFMVSMDYAEYGEDDPNAVYEREGLIEIKQGGFGVVHSEGCFTSTKDVFVNKIIVKQQKLKSGMLVKVKSRKVKENYPEVAFEVEIIGEYSENNFDFMESKPLSEVVNISAKDLTSFKIGGRYFVVPSDDSYTTTGDIYQEITKKYPNLVVEALFLNAMTERIPYSKVKNYTYINFSKQDEDMIVGTNLFFEKTKRLAETGKDVVVIINEISQFSKSYNNIFLKSNTYSEISNVAALRTKQLLSNAKTTENGSITIIAVDKLRVPMSIENLYKFEILPLFDK